MNFSRDSLRAALDALLYTKNNLKHDPLKCKIMPIHNQYRTEGVEIMQDKKQAFSRKLSLSSVAIGFLLALCLMLAFGAGGRSNSGGNYQCCAAGNDSLAVFVIDTQTGQTWRLSRADTCDFGTPRSRRSVQRSITPTVQ